MRLISTLLLSVVALTTEAAKPAYDGLVMTSIDVKRIGGNRVEFSGKVRGDEKDETAIIVKNVKEVRKEGNFLNRVPIFQAEEVSLSEVKKSVKKPLLCVHGFTVQPERHLEKCREAKDKFKKFTLIPVIWPTQAGNALNFLQRYSGDRGYSKAAGEAFKKSMAKYAGVFPRKSLVAHSMGNRVLRHTADAKYRFDNIFMVAADVNHNMFHKDYIEKGKEDSEQGLFIKRMLNDVKSRVYVLHNNQDFALLGSNIQKVFTVSRLGLGGVKADKLHGNLKGKIENVNCGQKWLNWTPRFAAHNYDFDDEAIEFYDSKCF